MSEATYQQYQKSQLEKQYEQMKNETVDNFLLPKKQIAIGTLSIFY